MPDTTKAREIAHAAEKRKREQKRLATPILKDIMPFGPRLSSLPGGPDEADSVRASFANDLARERQTSKARARGYVEDLLTVGDGDELDVYLRALDARKQGGYSFPYDKDEGLLKKARSLLLEADGGVSSAESEYIFRGGSIKHIGETPTIYNAFETSRVLSQLALYSMEPGQAAELLEKYSLDPKRKATILTNLIDDGARQEQIKVLINELTRPENVRNMGNLAKQGLGQLAQAFAPVLEIAKVMELDLIAKDALRSSDVFGGGVISGLDVALKTTAKASGLKLLEGDIIPGAAQFEKGAPDVETQLETAGRTPAGLAAQILLDPVGGKPLIFPATRPRGPGEIRGFPPKGAWGI